MKVFAIPTVTAGVGAGLSVLFFSGLSQVFGDTDLAAIILTQASVALVQMSVIPQGWVYVIGSQDADSLARRFSQAVTVELIGVVIGLTLISLLLLVPQIDQAQPSEGALLMFLSLAIQGSSSCMGRLRATENWRNYCLWNLTANIIRVPLIWATPALVHAGILPADMDRRTIILLYFLMPDLVRFLFIYMPQAVRHFRWPGVQAVVEGGRVILKNWFYDVASALTEVGDKIIVGTLLGPTILVAYFFARKLGVVSVMVVEPFHAEFYRRCASIADANEARREQRRIYVRGLGLTVLLFLGMALAIYLAAQVPMLSVLLPSSVIQHLGVFLLILAADCALSANRWGRYVAQMRGGAARLFAIRIVLFCVFVAGVALFGSALDGIGVGLALGLVWLLEALYIWSWLRYRRAESPVANGK